MLRSSSFRLSRAALRPVGARRYSALEETLEGHGGSMSFSLSDEQVAFQLMARQVAKEVIAPAAAELDVSMKFPEEIFGQLWEMGLVNAHIPEAYGGIGLHTLDGCVIQEELAWGCSAAWNDGSCFLSKSRLEFTRNRSCRSW